MYAVIRTGGKQYRVQPGDMLVVEKLDGEAGANIRFDQVLMHGDGDKVTLGGPLVDGALVHATLVETRKGEKVKIFKKIRRQNYRRTRGHRQWESVLRVTGLEIGGETTKWDGEVKLESKALLDARARGLKTLVAELEAAAAPAPKAAKTTAPAKAAAKKAVAADVVDEQEAANEAPAVAEAPKPKKAKAPKVEAAADAIDTGGTEADGVTVADVEAAPKKKAAPKAKPASETK
jgi:large subunit ribosomal protein L21